MNVPNTVFEGVSPPKDENAARFPRVLIVYHMCLNKADQHGLSLRSWFADWPRERLAQIYSGGEVGTERFCSRNFCLGVGERRWGKLFFRIKGSSLGEAGLPVVAFSQGMPVRRTLLSRLKGVVARGLMNSGLWELLFRPTLSPELERWVREFAPQVIYCQGYSLTFAWLPVLLHRRFGIPICFQTTDDWPKSLYGDSPFSWFVRPFVKRATEDLVSSAMFRFSFGYEMTREYSNRYRRDFESLLICDEMARFQSAVPIRLVEKDEFSIVYSGSLGLGRYQPLADLCRAAEELSLSGRQFKVFALVSGISAEGARELEGRQNLKILAAPSHEELPSYLKGADILFLPESFEIKQVEAIALSISSKAHLYMMSERPILVYGPPQAGSVKYAKKEGWACVVDQPGTEGLKGALERIVSEEEYRHQLVSRGTCVARENHDGRMVRTRFAAALRKLAFSGQS